MSQQNVDFIRGDFEHFLSKGEPNLATLDEAIKIHDHDIPERGEYQGHEGTLRWLQDWGAPWAEWSLEPEEFIDAGDRVVVIVTLRARGRGSGVELERRDAIVYEVRDDKIVSLDYYNNEAQALEAIGAPPRLEGE